MSFLKKTLYIKLAVVILLMWVGTTYTVLEYKSQNESFKYGLVEISSKLEELDARFQKYNRSYDKPKSTAIPE